MRHLGERLRVPAALFTAALLLGGAGIVPAAEDSDPDFSLDNTVQAGPFHLAPFFVIKDFGYDDNVRLGADRRFGDYTLTVGPGARAVVPFGRRAAWSAWDEIDYAIFVAVTGHDRQPESAGQGEVAAAQDPGVGLADSAG